MSYAGGVITDQSCGKEVNHSALVVGYGSENGLEYFLVKIVWWTKRRKQKSISFDTGPAPLVNINERDDDYHH